MAEEVVTWIDPDGVETVLGVEWNVDGRFSRATDFITDKSPGRPGQRVREIRHDTQPITAPLWIGPFDDDTALRLALRDLTYRLDPSRGPGVLRVQSPIGDTREVEAYADLAMPESLGDTSGPGWQRATVTFTAYESPYWQDPSDTHITVTAGDPVSFFPIFPLKLTSSEVFADFSVENVGDVEAWPVWTVHGPGEAPVFRNFNTGKVLSISGLTLSFGESVVIDTRPGVKTITFSDGSNVFSFIDAGSALFPLHKGVTSIRIEMPAALTQESSVDLSFRPRYLSP